MTRPVITALPPAPLRGEDAATFAAKANTFVAALPDFGTESNALGVFMENEADAAEASRIAAEAAETGAQAAETAAQAAQAAAEAASNATEWVSGQAYVAGDVVWSPITYLSYRATTSTSGTTDPSLSASWTSLGVPLPVSVANGGTGLTALGTATQVLAVNSGATALEYVTPAPPSVAGWTLLSTVTASDSATVDIETTFDATYDRYVIIATAVKTASATSLLGRLKIGGAYQTTGYNVRTQNSNSAFADVNAATVGTNIGNFRISNNLATGAADSLDLEMSISNPASTTLNKQIQFLALGPENSSNALQQIYGVAIHTGSAAALTGVRFFPSTGNIASGQFRLYGIRKT